MSILTYKIKHNRDLSVELKKARQIADFVLQNKNQNLTTKHVKQFGLKADISGQIIRKYTRNKKVKSIKSVVLTITGRDVKNKNNKIWISCLKLEMDFSFIKNITKINQIELDETYTYINCSVPDVNSKTSNSYIGVDRNATKHIAVCAIDSKIVKLGKKANHIHQKYKNIRKQAQKKKKYKFLKKLKNRERRIARDLNHKISRKIVNLANEKQYGIKLENLKGIRKKDKKVKIKKNKKETKFQKQKKELNNTKSNWSFYELEQFIKYKAKLLGIEVSMIDPYMTSQNCSKCGLLGVREKKSFMCPQCGHTDHADANASFNIVKASVLK